MFATVRPFELMLAAEVRRAASVGRTCLHERVSKGLWTTPVRVSGRTTGWPAREVAALNAARIAGKSDDEIRLLVQQLHAQRLNALTHQGEAQ